MLLFKHVSLNVQIQIGKVTLLRLKCMGRLGNGSHVGIVESVLSELSFRRESLWSFIENVGSNGASLTASKGNLSTLVLEA